MRRLHANSPPSARPTAARPRKQRRAPTHHGLRRRRLLLALGACAAPAIGLRRRARHDLKQRAVLVDELEQPAAALHVQLDCRTAQQRVYVERARVSGSMRGDAGPAPQGTHEKHTRAHPRTHARAHAPA
jgi:hypothetical protein